MVSASAVAVVVLIQQRVVDALQHLLRECTEQRPCNIERSKNVAFLIDALRKELVLKLVQKLEVQEILRAECLLSNHSLAVYRRLIQITHSNNHTKPAYLHCLDILSNSIVGVQLI